MAGRISQDNVSDGLLMYLDAANTESYLDSGSVWNDLSLNNSNANLVNSPTFTTDSKGGFELNGTNQYFAISNVDLNFVNKPFSLLSWVKINSLPTGSGNIFFGKKRNSGSNTFTQFHINPDKKLRLLLQNGVSSGNFIGDGSDLTLGYHHACVTVDINNVTFYLDGEVYGNVISNTSNVLPDYSGSVSDWWLGRLDANTFGDFYGDQNIYTSKIYNRVLSLKEVLLDYNGKKGRFGL